MIDEVARHIEALVAELKAPVEIRQIDPEKGKGAFAIADICRGTILWKEACRRSNAPCTSQQNGSEHSKS